MLPIKKQFVSQALADKITYAATNKQLDIVIHETANTARGANAKAHANLQSNGNTRDASWHYQVSDTEIIQSFPHEESVWAAGKTANLQGIHIEICVNSDGNFKKAVDNAVDLVKHIMKEEKIPVERVRQHNYYTGKNCPTNLRNGSKGITWAQFIDKIKSAPASAPKPTPKPTTPAPKDASKIRVIVDNLNYYNSPNWTKPAGTVQKGTLLTVKNKHKVDGGYQYELISGTFITANEKYVEIVNEAKPAQSTPKPKEQRVEILAGLLNYYNKPTWSGAAGTVRRGEVFTVIEKVKVDNAYQYKLKSGTYITANEKYVRLV